MTREDAIKIWAEHNRRDAHWEPQKGGEFVDTLIALGLLKLYPRCKCGGGPNLGHAEGCDA